MDDEEAFLKAHRQKYWGKRVAIKDSPESVRVDGVQYIMALESQNLSGLGAFGGANHYIRFNDGRLAQSRNLWLSGPIPSEFRDHLPDNAQLLTQEEYQVLTRQTEGAAETPVDRAEASITALKGQEAIKASRAGHAVPPGEWPAGFNDALKLRMVEGEVDWSGVEPQAKAAILAREVDFARLTREQFEFVYQDIEFDKFEPVDSKVARGLFEGAQVQVGPEGPRPSSPNHFEVWHANDLFAALKASYSDSPKPQFPDEYAMVGVVQADNVDAVFTLTNSFEQNWVKNPKVIQSVGEARSSSVGDVFVGDGVAYRVESYGFERLTPEPVSIEKEADPKESLYDAIVRTQFAEAMLITPSRIGNKTLEEARERYLAEMDKYWPDFQEHVKNFTPKRIETLLDRYAAYEASFNPHLVGKEAPLRQLTEELIVHCKLDHWPGRATVVDFGLDSPSHLGALQYALREEIVSPQELDAAMGNGQWLTSIAQRGGENPYRNVTFHTAWDDIYGLGGPPLPKRPEITAVDPPTHKLKPLTL